MTLSRFLRDFLYIPLGGNRGGRRRTIRNVMITMLLGGLWHGAAWGFVLWGALHGACLAMERMLSGRVHAPAWLRCAIVFNVVTAGWILFRSRDLGPAAEFVSRLGHPGPATLWSVPVVLAVVATIGLQLLPPRPLEGLRIRIARLSPVPLASALAVVIAFVGATVPSDAVPPFIYFQF